MNKEIIGFVNRLARVKVQSDAYNQYAPGNVYNGIRRQNLTRYLEQMLDRQPIVTLVMEAPGYRGGPCGGSNFTAYGRRNGQSSTSSAGWQAGI